MALSLAAFSWLGQGPLRADDLTKQFEEQYLANVPTLMERYVHNRKLRATDRGYNGREILAHGNYPFPFTELEINAIADTQNIRVHWAHAKDTNISGTWLLLQPHDFFEIGRNADNTCFVLKQHLQAGPLHEDARCLSSLMLPMLYSRTFTLEYCLLNAKATVTQREVVSMIPTTLEGRPVTEVNIRARSTISSWLKTLYIDTEHAWIIRKTVDHPPELHPKVGLSPGYGSETEIEYKDSAEGYPLPTRFVSYRLGPDGTRTADRTVEIHEYSRYTPDPSELRLESFDFTEPKKTMPNDPASPFWLFRLAAVVCIMLGAFLLLRRSRKKRTPPPAPTTP
jgi:hypothetical protein